MVTIQLQKEASDATDVVHVRWQVVHVEMCEVSDVGCGRLLVVCKEQCGVAQRKLT